LKLANQSLAAALRTLNSGQVAVPNNAGFAFSCSVNNRDPPMFPKMSYGNQLLTLLPSELLRIFQTHGAHLRTSGPHLFVFEGTPSARTIKIFVINPQTHRIQGTTQGTTAKSLSTLYNEKQAEGVVCIAANAYPTADNVVFEHGSGQIKGDTLLVTNFENQCSGVRSKPFGRVAIGYTNESEAIYLIHIDKCTLYDFASCICALNIKYAINLNVGNSAGMIINSSKCGVSALRDTGNDEPPLNVVGIDSSPLTYISVIEN
jgi:hypothetical protein